MHTVTSTFQSRVIMAPIGLVWERIRSGDLAFWSAVDATHDKDGNGKAPLLVGGTKIVRFKDGATQTNRILELSDLHHQISWELIESDPPVKALAALHSISLQEITHTNATLVRFSSEYPSAEEVASIVEDSKYKKAEALADLAASMSG